MQATPEKVGARQEASATREGSGAVMYMRGAASPVHSLRVCPHVAAACRPGLSLLPERIADEGRMTGVDQIVEVVEPSASPSVAVRVWDLPTRLFHWVLVVSILGSFTTGYLGGNAM